MCALVGEARTGKSNLLATIRSLLDPAAAPLVPTDASEGGEGRIRIRARIADGARLSLDATPPDLVRAHRAGAPPVLFLPADLRSGPVVSPGWSTGPPAPRAAEILARTIPALGSRDAEPGPETESARAFVGGASRRAGPRGCAGWSS